MYCIITTCSVECYCSDDTEHYKCDETVNFCAFRCATKSPITVFINVVFYIYICCFFYFPMPKLNACNIPQPTTA